MSEPLILLVEDEDHIAQGLLFNLAAEGYRTHHEADGDDALAYLLAAPTNGPEAISAVLLDCMLPGRDGFSIARNLRESGRFVPILMLTALSSTEDILEGLEAGADDYLPKPFDLDILLARLKTLLRRTSWQAAQNPPANHAAEQQSDQPANQPTPTTPASAEYHLPNRIIRFDALEIVSRNTPAQTTRLTLMEADLLRYLTDREGRIVSRKEILEEVWRVHEDTDTRAIDNFIVRLRRYIEDDPGSPVHLQTVRGVGYRFVAQPQP